MTYLGALALGMVIHEGTRGRLSSARAAGVAVSVAFFVAEPRSLPIVIAGWGWARYRVRGSRPAPSVNRHQPDHLGQVLFIALSAGLPVAGALEFAADEIEDVEASQVRAVLRAARRQGLAAALAGLGGSSGGLFRVLARAQLTGSSVTRAVASFVDEERKNRRARAVEAAQRLPVKLTVPLALLILPGFVFLTVGPTVISIFRRLLGPLLS